MKKITVEVESAEEGGYTATVKEMPGCVTEGDSLPELFVNVADAVQGWCDAGSEKV